VITALAFLAAAAAGALGRAALGHRYNRAFPTGTLLVNVSGSFALGLLHGVTPPLVTVVGVGGLGAYTTFSSFARDLVALAEERRYVGAAAYGVATCVTSVAVAWAAVLLVT
jgi:CrcB protein